MLIDFYQYRVWTNCNNNCKFCLHKGVQKYTVSQMKASLVGINQLILDSMKQEMDISLIGGEIFDDQLDDLGIREAFYSILNTCALKYRNGKLRRMMICTSLIFDINRHLIPCLDWCRKSGLIDILMLCTSYDTVYRFKSTSDEALWKVNMNELKKYVSCTIHTEMILTHDLIGKILNNEFDVDSFQKVHSTNVDFIEPSYISFYKTKENTIRIIPKFFPTRKEFINLVKEKCIIQKKINLDLFLNINLRSKYVFFQNLDTGKWIKVDDKWKSDCRRFDENGNKVRIYTYSDSDKSMTDDIQILKKMYEQ